MYRGETSPPSPAPHGSPGQGEARAQWVTASPCRHSLAEEPQPQRHLVSNLLQQTRRLPVSQGKGSHCGGTAPCRPSWGVTCVEGGLRGEQEQLQMGQNTAQGIPRGATVPQPPALSPQPVGGGSVPGWKGLVDNHLHNKILLDLGLLQSCAVSEQLA